MNLPAATSSIDLVLDPTESAAAGTTHSAREGEIEELPRAILINQFVGGESSRALGDSIPGPDECLEDLAKTVWIDCTVADETENPEGKAGVAGIPRTHSGCLCFISQPPTGATNEDLYDLDDLVEESYGDLDIGGLDVKRTRWTRLCMRVEAWRLSSERWVRSPSLRQWSVLQAIREAKALVTPIN
ncbi:hypothetical protein M409DRAFT_22411 [Zasmidium cellare ATCC 36951]|uniref:Uncharacterized protein n=1 Tax=Zasmidium cellare ATCC 36951 TaxID=1080233 RepID=A0A6A6CN98_ZASCE|nr:uncharacterized protein M409DRAFT_22411 [Zasmidium cellare ATCC 36951]KAF2167610.1 hypothetical protein M409DRAFT_22411 [Zasmidium cellare ATCC 36951]